ncbi:MAG: ferredoxin [Rhodobiaceae bacterium]|nr:ferredoxin [Rhodobiaceae bacterium]MCC0056638.1 ferredoxin [Rhodobiaceae bacterium]
MRVIVHSEKCIGSGRCTELAGSVFDQGEDDGIVVLVSPKPSDDQREAVRDAVQSCPVSAIEIVED